MSAYNIWANQKLVTYLQNLPQEQVTMDLKGSFPSIESTIQHMWYAEDVWTCRLQSRPLPSVPHIGVRDGEAFWSGLPNQSEQLRAHVQDLSEKQLTHPVAYHTGSSEQYQQTPFEMLMHVLNHSTYHRGQLVNYARALGYTQIPSTDLIYYLREMDRSES